MDNNFDDIYNKIIHDNANKVQNPNIRFFILFCVMVVMSFIALKIFGEKLDYLLIILFIIYILVITLFIIEQKKYTINYKNRIVKNVVMYANSKLNYQVKYDIGVWNYKKSKLPEKFDTFISRDGIYGNINNNTNLKMAYISTNKKIIEQENGNVRTDNINTFYGIFGFVIINNNIKTTIEIKTNDFKQNYNKKRIELESSEFEKKYDCFADNKIVALQILTPQIIDALNEYSNIIKAPIEITINNSTIYFRILMKDIFEAPKIGNPFKRERVQYLYNIVYDTQEIVKKISDNMMEIR